MGYLKHLFRHKNEQEVQEVVQDNKQQEHLNQSKIYLDADMADDIVNILNNINKQQ